MTNLVREHTSPPAGMVFYDSLESARSDAGLLRYWSVIERAWSEIKLDGVLCLDGRPVLYLKEYARPFSTPERIRLQRLFWNQGVANILVLADPTSVYIYSGLARPLPDDSDEEERKYALVQKLTLAEYVKRIQPLYHDLATGHYYETNSEHFNPDQSVDSYLLDNLSSLRDTLITGDEGLDIKEAHAFIGRMLFLCYLLDRGIVSVEGPGDNLTGTMLLTRRLEERRPSHRKQIDFLYGLFNDLKDQFNGNMFDQDLDAEKHLMQPSHLKKLVLFLGGHSVKSGQLTFDFWAYDFKMIPVETISAIYQDFLGTENPEDQRKRGAFYTPRFLAEMVVDMALQDKQEAFDWSFLDPSCGSGIFLVILFNRLANRFIHNHAGRLRYRTKATALQKILETQIRGVDIEETACRIACFSLYLAYLDFFNPPDIKKYIKETGKPLPKLLVYGAEPNRPGADIPVIHRADFLAEGTLAGKTFDCLIGNPPWEGRGSKQLAQKFMEKAPLLLRDNGTGCLLLPTKILQNQTDAFQAKWLGQVTLEKVLQLADYRRLLFKDAKTPAFIARFKKTPPHPTQHLVEFSAPKFNRDGLRQGIVTVNPSARTWIPLSGILSATKSKTAPVVWKRRLWGTPRDQKLLDLFQSLPPLSELAGAPKEGKRWVKGQGFQPYYLKKAESDPNYPIPKPNHWSPSTLFIRPQKHVQMIVFQQDCITLGKQITDIGATKKFFRRASNPNLFESPMVLISKGFSKVAYCDFDVLFQHSLQSIAGPSKDADLLMFLTAYLRSNLARYFLFHTAANWGTERKTVHLNELLRVPFPLPENEFVSPEAGRIVENVAVKIRKLPDELRDTLSELHKDARRQFFNDAAITERRWRLKRKEQVDTLQKNFEPLIYDYFGLTDQEITIVEDTIRVFEPSSTPAAWRSEQTVTLDPVENTKVEPYKTEGLRAYANTLTTTLNTWAQTEGSDYRVQAEGGTDDQTGLAMVTINLSDATAPYQKKSLSGYLAKILKKIHQSVSRRRGALLYERDIFLFEGDQIYIVRPNILLNWTRTAALNDAARIYGDIALAHKRSLDGGR